VLFNTAFCFIYIAFILLQPVETKPVMLMLSAFALGLLTDMFYDHAGMHAAATVATAYVRNYWLAALNPQGGYDAGASPTLPNYGLIWFISYAWPLIFIHHVILFFIEAGGFGYTGLTLAKTFASVLFSGVVLLLHQFFFYSKTR
jgi:hypothetical protein